MAGADAAAPDRFLRLAEVIEIAGLSKAMIYRKARAGTFPAPYKPGGTASRWSEREVLNWQMNVRKISLHDRYRDSVIGKPEDENRKE